MLLLRRLLSGLTLVAALLGPAQARDWSQGLPGPEYHWTGLGAWVANNLKERDGYACGKMVWLPDPQSDTLRPKKILWSSAGINDPIPDDMLAEGVIVSVALTAECENVVEVAWQKPLGPPRLLHYAASPAILTNGSSSPWTVDATYNSANSAIYVVGPGGNGGQAVTNHVSVSGGGGGAIVFGTNYTFSGGTATFSVPTGSSGAEGTSNATLDSSAWIARSGAAGTTSTAPGGSGASSTVPAGGTKHSGGNGGAAAGTVAQQAGGGGGGGAGGTTGNGANGGTSASATGAGGGGGADNGITGSNGSGATGGNGGASGLVGSTGGSGATFGGSAPTSGTLGAGGGGAASDGNCSAAGIGAPGSSGGTQFDSSHGAGGGGGGGPSFDAQTSGCTGGNGGNYGGGAGGSGSTATPPGNPGSGGQSIAFISWVPNTSHDSKAFLHAPLTHW